MNQLSGRAANRLETALAWTILTDAPLQGLCLAREGGLLLAWDEADQLYLFDTQGERRSASRAPDKILAGAISDSGTLIALLGKGRRLWLLSADLEPIAERSAPSDAGAVAIDPHGRYLALGTKLNTTYFFTKHGRAAGKLETQQPLAQMCFVPNEPWLVATAAYGAILGAELFPSGAGGQLDAEVAWQHALMSNVGRLATTGDGGMVLASCFTHGVQRYDLRGHNEGSYHLGGTAAHAVPDFAGRLIVVATTEGELAVLNGAGNVRWKTALPRPVRDVELDALGRFLIYGLATGEITRIDLEAGDRARSRKPAAPVEIHSPRAERSGSVRLPAWTAPVADTDQQAESAAVAVLDEPPRIAFMTGRNQLQLFTDAGHHLGQGPEMIGVGRLLRTAPGWIGGCTDRQVVLYDARRNLIQRLDLSLSELTHLELRPETYGIAIVQERDRIGRATPAGRWIWKRELRSGIEDLAIGPGGSTGVTTERGELLIFDAAGAPAGQFSAAEAEALCLVEAPPEAPQGVAWITLARRFQTLLGHDVRGRVVWQTPIPWEGWDLVAAGPFVIATAPDGKAIAFDGAGQVKAQSREGDPLALYAQGPDQEPRMIVRQGVHLLCSDMTGHIHWRAVADGALGPMAAGQQGVAAMIGRSLAWFPAVEPAKPHAEI